MLDKPYSGSSEAVPARQLVRDVSVYSSIPKQSWVWCFFFFLGGGAITLAQLLWGKPFRDGNLGSPIRRTSAVGVHSVKCVTAKSAPATACESVSIRFPSPANRKRQPVGNRLFGSGRAVDRNPQD